MKYYDDYQWTGMLLRAGCWLISPAEKDLTTSSNCSGRQRHGVILKEHLSEKDALTNKKACLTFPQLHPWVKSPLNLQSNHILCAVMIYCNQKHLQFFTKESVEETACFSVFVAQSFIACLWVHANVRKITGF